MVSRSILPFITCCHTNHTFNRNSERSVMHYLKTISQMIFDSSMNTTLMHASTLSSSPFAFINYLLSFCPEALRLVVEAAKPGVSVLSLCERGDAYIMAETGKVFKKEKEMKKGEPNIVQMCVKCIWMN